MADDGSNDILASLAGLQAVGSAVGGWAQSQALNNQASFATQMAQINQRFAQYRANDLIRQGDQQADQLQKQGQQFQGTQRAAAASQGIRVDDGSAGEQVLATQETTANNQITARNNAWREAYGLQVQSNFAVSQAKLQQSGARAAAAGTLLGGTISGLPALSRMSGYLNKSKGGSGSTLLGSLDLNKSQQLTLPGQSDPNEKFYDWFSPGGEDN